MHCRGLFVGVLSVVLVLLGNTLFAAESTEEALTAIRAALAGRDIEGAKTAIEAAKKVPGDQAYDDARGRLEELTDNVQQFWNAYDKSLTTLAAVEELKVGDTFIAIVEVGPDKLIVRASGTNRTYTRKTVPAGIALEVTERVLKPTDAMNKVIIGSFAAMDAKGDLGKARKYWQEAIAAGVDVKRLLPELDAPRPLPPVTIPDLTAQQKAMLDPRLWQQRTPGPKGFTKGNVEIAEQNDEGRMEVNVPDDMAEVVIATKKPVLGDFAFRVTFENVQAGQQFGLYSGDKEDAVVVDLPEGTFVLDFFRQGAAYKATIAKNEVDVKTVGKPATRFPGGLLGISAKAGQSFKISAIEVGAK